MVSASFNSASAFSKSPWFHKPCNDIEIAFIGYEFSKRIGILQHVRVVLSNCQIEQGEIGHCIFGICRSESDNASASSSLLR